VLPTPGRHFTNGSLHFTSWNPARVGNYVGGRDPAMATLQQSCVGARKCVPLGCPGDLRVCIISVGDWHSGSSICSAPAVFSRTSKTPRTSRRSSSSEGLTAGSDSLGIWPQSCCSGRALILRPTACSLMCCGPDGFAWGRRLRKPTWCTILGKSTENIGGKFQCSFPGIVRRQHDLVATASLNCS
jgi:hypothetical protein